MMISEEKNSSNPNPGTLALFFHKNLGMSCTGFFLVTSMQKYTPNLIFLNNNNNNNNNNDNNILKIIILKSTGFC